MPTVFSNYRRTLILLWLAAAFFLGLTWLHVKTLVDENRAKVMVTAERDLANLTRVSQEHANRTFRATDQVIRFIQSRYLEIGNKLNLTELTAKGVIDAEIFPQVGIIDAKGIYALANRPIKGKLDLSDREHFKVHVASDTGALFISKPVLGRSTGKWSIQLTRRINDSNGVFAGVVVVSVDPGYFTRFYSDLKLGSQGVVALYGLDGIARARKVGDKEEFGSDASGARVFQSIAQGRLEGSYINTSVVDQVERLYHYRKMPNYDLVVIDGIEIKNLLANHNQATEALSIQAGIVSVLIVALALALTRYLRQLRREMGIRQRAQRSVEERNEILNAIFELSPDGFVSFDAQRRVTYFSPAFLQLIGEPAGPIIGFEERQLSDWLLLCCKEGSTFRGIAALRAEITAGHPEKRELLQLGSSVKRVLQVGLRCGATSLVSQILYLRDVTHETEVDQMKSEFLATAAHELRTPMAGILGFSEVLLNDEFDAATRHEFLETIYNQSKLMAAILNELLDLARIEARRDKDFRYTQVNLPELLTDLVRSYPLPPGRSAPVLELPSQDLLLMADAGKLRQALLNVISNAYKYSPQGGPVHIKAWVRDVAGDSAGVCVEVTDHGIGLTTEQLARVCERFYRADTSGRILGTGLGMSIVKEIVELHRGQLSLTSTLGQGTCVRLCLPAYYTLQDRRSGHEPLGAVTETRPSQLN